MRRDRRMADDRRHVAQRRGERDRSQRLHEAIHGLAAARDLERDHVAEPFAEQPHGRRLCMASGLIGAAGIEHAPHPGRLTREKIRQRRRIRIGARDPQLEGVHAALGEPAVERAAVQTPRHNRVANRGRELARAADRAVASHSLWRGLRLSRAHDPDSRRDCDVGSERQPVRLLARRARHEHPANCGSRAPMQCGGAGIFSGASTAVRRVFYPRPRQSSRPCRHPCGCWRTLKVFRGTVNRFMQAFDRSRSPDAGRRVDDHQPSGGRVASRLDVPRARRSAFTKAASASRLGWKRSRCSNEFGYALAAVAPPDLVDNPRGFAPRTPRHALSRAASPARSARVARSPGSLAL